MWRSLSGAYDVPESPEFDEITGAPCCRQESSDANVACRFDPATLASDVAERVSEALRDGAGAHKAVNCVALRAPKFKAGDRVRSCAGIAGTVGQVLDEPHYAIEYDTSPGRVWTVLESFIVGTIEREGSG